MGDNSKKSYNYMASPNYLQYENTYQKYKNMCHNKDVTNFRENSLNHKEQHRRSGYRDDDLDEFVLNERFANNEMKTENTMQSSDDEGGFRQDAVYTKNQFNHNNSVNSSNIANGNIGYSTKEIEPLLHGGHVTRESIQMLTQNQNYEPPHYANPAAMIAMHNMQKQHLNRNSMENQHSNRCHHNKYNQQNQYQFQHQQHRTQSPYRKVPPPPAVRPYTKPLPKLPTNIGEFMARNSISKFCFFQFVFSFQMKVPNHQTKISVELIHQVLVHQMKTF